METRSNTEASSKVKA